MSTSLSQQSSVSSRQKNCTVSIFPLTFRQLNSTGNVPASLRNPADTYTHNLVTFHRGGKGVVRLRSMLLRNSVKRDLYPLLVKSWKPLTFRFMPPSLFILFFFLSGLLEFISDCVDNRDPPKLRDFPRWICSLVARENRPLFICPAWKKRRSNCFDIHYRSIFGVRCDEPEFIALFDRTALDLAISPSEKVGFSLFKGTFLKLGVFWQIEHTRLDKYFLRRFCFKTILFYSFIVFKRQKRE